ncbi:MAG: shikimate dehydrogenase, partial [Candidatus Omnitrophica bacterium]|nr:shikimate dehydrogenase [Candidatus Omnitrophota bacterium]
MDSRTRIYGILGDPVEHSLSPALHNAVFKARGVNAVYVAFRVIADEFAGAMEGLKSLGIAGVNITLPHKEQAVFYVDAVPNPAHKAIGAVNTIAVAEGRLLGFNTDAMGFINDLKARFTEGPEGRMALVLGAGGAARAVCFGLLEAGVQNLVLHNRSHERGLGLTNYLKQFYPGRAIRAVQSVTELGREAVDFLVNATSCGMKPDDPYPVNPDILERTRRVYDLVYAPRRSRLVEEAARRGIPAHGGLGMLIEQAVAAHRLWFPEADTACERALINRLRIGKQCG